MYLPISVCIYTDSNLQPCTIILECYKTLQDICMALYFIILLECYKTLQDVITYALDLAEAYIIELAEAYIIELAAP